MMNQQSRRQLLKNGGLLGIIAAFGSTLAPRLAFAAWNKAAFESKSLADAYKAKFVAHRGALEAIAQKSGWTFFVHRTDRAPQTALLSLFTALADMRAWKS